MTIEIVLHVISAIVLFLSILFLILADGYMIKVKKILDELKNKK